MRHAIALGLRAELHMQSFVTGVLYIDLDMHPGTEAKFSMNTIEKREARYQGIEEIPVLPTALEQAQETLTKIVNALGKADIPALFNSISQTAQGVSRLCQFQRSQEQRRSTWGGGEKSLGSRREHSAS